MGYLTTVTGRLNITPPLTAKELRDLPDDFGVLAVYVETAERDTDDGVLTVRTGTAVVPAYEDSVKAYEWHENVTRAVEAVTAAGAGHAVAGVLYVAGEDQGNVQRAVVTGSVVVFEKARLVWPDGADVEKALL